MGSLDTFRANKYGLFIHFGLYSLLGGHYQGQATPGLGEWILHDLAIPREDYRSLAARFDPAAFDAEAIAAAAVRWGMRYICFTAKHHDGFALYRSRVSPYNSVDASPCGRDFVGELAAACARHQLQFCLYYSQAQDWDDPNAYEAGSENSGKQFSRYFQGKCLPQLGELLSHYGPVHMLWLDTPMGMSEAECQELRDYVKRLQPDCLLSGRIGHGLGDFATTQDQRIPAAPAQGAWEIPETLNGSFGYYEGDENWRSPQSLLEELLKVSSRGGNLLLNVGPDGSGRIPAGAVQSLDALGSWLRGKEAGIYNTAPCPPYVYEAPGIIFTCRPYHLYLHIARPERFIARDLPLPNAANHAVAASLLGTGETAEDGASAPALPGAGPAAGEGKDGAGANAAANAVRLKETRTLEGDPYWGIRLPASVAGAPLSCVTVDVKLAEPDVRFAPLGF